jgi:hypothetical protein
MVQERHSNAGGGDLGLVGTSTPGVHVECGLLDSKHGRVGVPVPTKELSKKKTRGGLPLGSKNKPTIRLGFLATAAKT